MFGGNNPPTLVGDTPGLHINQPSQPGQPLTFFGGPPSGWGAQAVPNQPGLFGMAPPPPIPEDEPAMGKRMVTVEVTGTQSSALRSGRLVVTCPGDIEAEAAAVAEALAERGCAACGDKAIVHTTVSGRLMDKAGAVVVEVYPFVVRTSVGAGCEELVDAVRDHLCAGVHPAPCGLYARRVSKGGDVSVSGGDVVAAAKAVLCGGGGGTLGLCWDVRVCATVVEVAKVMKEVEVRREGDADWEAMPPPPTSGLQEFNWEAATPAALGSGRFMFGQSERDHVVSDTLRQRQTAAKKYPSKKTEGNVISGEQLGALFGQSAAANRATRVGKASGFSFK